MTITVETLRAMQRKMDRIMAGTGGQSMLYATPIYQSANALKDTTERLFSASKNRSRRIHKKLVKRHGGEFRKAPAVFRTPHGIVCHPALYASIKRVFDGEQVAGVAGEEQGFAVSGEGTGSPHG